MGAQIREWLGIRYEFNWGIVLVEPYFTWFLNGLKFTAILTIVTTVTSLVLGVAVGIMRCSENAVFRRIAGIYVEIFRNIPGMFWLFFFYFAFPQLLPGPWSQALNSYRHYALIAAILGLTFDNSSYVAEIVRSGIQGIPSGQTEAAKSIGLNDWQRWRYVILPQAVRIVVPPLGTRMIHNLKNTSLAMVIGVPELSWTTRQVESITFRGFEMTTLVTAVYVTLCLTMATGVNWLETRLTRKHGLATVQ